MVVGVARAIMLNNIHTGFMLAEFGSLNNGVCCLVFLISLICIT